MSDEPVLDARGLAHSYGRLVALAGLTSPSRPASASRSSAPTAAASRPPSARSPACSSRATARSASAGTTRTASRTPRTPAPRSRSCPTRRALRRPHGPPAPRAGGALARRRRRRPDERIDELLDRLGLAARADFLPRELSRGMRQKTQLACALIRPARAARARRAGRRPRPAVAGAAARAAARAQAGAERRCCSRRTRWRFADGLADRAVMLDEGEVADEGPWRRGARAGGGARMDVAVAAAPAGRGGSGRAGLVARAPPAAERSGSASTSSTRS